MTKITKYVYALKELCSSLNIFLEMLKISTGADDAGMAK